jgi:hypothetical protein
MVRRRGQVEEIFIGLSASKVLVRILPLVAGVASLVAGVVQWDDIVSSLSSFKILY